MQGKLYQSLVNKAVLENTWQQYTVFAPEAVNQEPFPDFDLEINKEDKDKDLDNPKIRKDQNDEEKKDDDKTNPPPSK